MHRLIYGLILVRLPFVVAVLVTSVLLTNKMMSCDGCQFGVAQQNEWCHMGIFPYDLAGQKLEYTAFEGGQIASVNISASSVNVTQAGSPLRADECKLLVAKIGNTSWTVSDASHTDQEQLTLVDVRALETVSTPHCSFDSGDSKVFETEDLPREMKFAPIVWGVFKMVGWYAEKRKWEMKSEISMEDQERIAKQEGWLGKLLSGLGYVIFTFAPNQLLAPLTSIALHKDCPQLIMMSYASSVWKNALMYGAVVVAFGITYLSVALVLLLLTCVFKGALGTEETGDASCPENTQEDALATLGKLTAPKMLLAGTTYGICACLACPLALLMYGGFFALLVGGIYFMGYFAIQYALNVNPALLLGIDLRYLIVFSWPEVGISLQGSLLRVFMALNTCMDVLVEVIKQCKRKAPAVSSDKSEGDSKPKADVVNSA